MSELSTISELVKDSVLVALEHSYTRVLYGKCKALFVYTDGGITVQIEVNNELMFDNWYNTNELMKSLQLIAQVSAFIIAYKD